GRGASAFGVERGPAVALRADQAGHALRDRRYLRPGAGRLLSMLERVPEAPDPRESDRTGLPLRVYVRRSGSTDSLVRVETRLPSDVTVVEEAVELIVRHC